MKRFPQILAVITVLLYGPFVSADTPANIILEVKSASTTGGAKRLYESRNGSYDTSFDRKRAVEITLRSLGVDQPRPINVQIWWIGQLSGTTTRVVLSKNATVKNVSNNLPQIWTEESTEVKGRDMNLRGIHHRTQTGARILGWIVEAEGDGFHNVQTSDPSLQDLASSPQLKEMEKTAAH
jgi:hypothetical protein